MPNKLTETVKSLYRSSKEWLFERKDIPDKEIPSQSELLKENEVLFPQREEDSKIGLLVEAPPRQHNMGLDLQYTLAERIEMIRNGEIKPDLSGGYLDWQINGSANSPAEVSNATPWLGYATLAASVVLAFLASGCGGDSTPTGPSNGADNGVNGGDGNGTPSNGNAPPTPVIPVDPLQTLAPFSVTDQAGIVTISGATDSTGQYLELRYGNNPPTRINATDQGSAILDAISQYFLMSVILNPAGGDNRPNTAKGPFWPLMLEDLNGNGGMDVSDVVMALKPFGTISPQPNFHPADFNRDGVVGLSDVKIVGEAYTLELIQKGIEAGLRSVEYGTPLGPFVTFPRNENLAYMVKILKGRDPLLDIERVPSRYLETASGNIVELPLHTGITGDNPIQMLPDVEYHTFVGGIDSKGHMLEGGSGFYLDVILDQSRSSRINQRSRYGYDVRFNLPLPLPSNLGFYVEAVGDSTQSPGTQPVTVTVNDNARYNLFVQNDETELAYVSGTTGVARPFSPIPTGSIGPGANTIRVEGNGDAAPIRLVLATTELEFGAGYQRPDLGK